MRTCLNWSIKDIDWRIDACGLVTPFMTETDKEMILDDFFEENEELIIDFINLRLNDYLNNLTDFQPSKKPL